MKALPIEITRSMVRANSAWKIAGPRHGTTSMRTFGAARVTFSINGGINSSTARSGIISRNCRSLRAASKSSGTVAHRFIADGDIVAVEAKGDNVTPEGLRYDNDYCLLFQFEDGKIKESREYCDSILTEKALGPFPQADVRAAS